MAFVAPISNEILDNIIRDIDQGKKLRAINKMRLCIMDSGNQGQGEDRDPFSTHAYDPLRRWTGGEQYLIVPVNQFKAVPGYPGMYTYTIQVPGYNPAAASIPGYARQNAVSAGSRAQPTSLMPGGSVAGGSIQRAGVATVRTGQIVQQRGAERIPVAPAAQTVQMGQRVQQPRAEGISGAPVAPEAGNIPMGERVSPLIPRRGRKRRKPNSSCQYCYANKRKCDKKEGDEKCFWCITHGQECEPLTEAFKKQVMESRKRQRVKNMKRKEAYPLLERPTRPPTGDCKKSKGCVRKGPHPGRCLVRCTERNASGKQCEKYGSHTSCTFSEQ